VLQAAFVLAQAAEQRHKMQILSRMGTLPYSASLEDSGVAAQRLLLRLNTALDLNKASMRVPTMGVLQ
jgi:hypothetical protein